MRTPTSYEETIIEELRTYVLEEVLHGDAPDLDASTPLLALGIIDSLTMVSLLAFIDEQFGVHIPDDEVKPEYFETLTALSRLVTRSPPTIRARETGLAATVRILEPYGITSRRIDLGPDGNLHLLHTEGTAPPWVFLPALGSPATAWGAMLRTLAGAVETYSIDFAGFGMSTSREEMPTCADHVRMVLRALDELKHPRVVLIGSSAGAMVATELARRLPDRVVALVVLGFGRIPEPRAWWADLSRISTEPDRFLSAAYFHPPVLSSILQKILHDTLEAPAYHTFLDNAALDAMSSAFDNIRVPTLFISGEEDRIIPQRAVQDAAARVSGSRIEWLARCGHFPHVERSQETVSLIRDFVERITNAATGGQNDRQGP